MAEIKNMRESLDQKLMEGLDSAGITEHEVHLLNQVFKEEERLVKETLKMNFVKGVVLGMILVTLVFVVGKYV